MSTSTGPTTSRSAAHTDTGTTLTTRPEGVEALEDAADQAMLAPSVHNTQPWKLILRPDRLEIRADRSRQLSALDPLGRELVQSLGAALFNVRVALAARGWAVEVDRLPQPKDPDLIAVVHLVEGLPEDGMAALDPMIARRRTNRRRYDSEPVPDDVLDHFRAMAAGEDTVLVPVRTEEHRRLVARLTQQADHSQNAAPAYRAELRRWTTRAATDGDGVAPVAVPHVDGTSHDDIPIRDFDTQGAGSLPAATHSSTDQTLVLLASRHDDPLAWLRSGEALERVLLEATALGWVASPLTQAIEVPVTRTALRSALAWDVHPQTLLRIGRAEPTAATPRRHRADVVQNSTRVSGPQELPSRSAPHPSGRPDPAHGRHPDQSEPRPVSDGRGGTTWV